MSMEIDFRTLLAGNAGLAGFVIDRIEPSTFDQASASPAIRYQKITSLIGLHMGGSDGLQQATMQVDIRGVTAVSVFAVRDAVVQLLHGFQGVVGGTNFRVIELSSDRGVSFDKTDADAFYLGSLDFTVISRAAAA